eukprot:PITA_24650
MLREYVMQQPSRWEDYLHLVEFAYNNGYHTSLQMSPFEVLYGRKFRTPSSWGGLEDKLMLGPEMLKEMDEMVKKVRTNLKATQDRQKSFANRKRSFKKYQVGDHVYIRIQAKRSSLQWSGCTKLAPRFCGPFQVKPEGEFMVEPLSTIKRREVMLRKRVITQVKLQWQHFRPNEAT